MKMSKLPSLSIIIPSYNSKNHYKSLIGSLLRIDYPKYEIIIVDDGSTDGSFEKMKKMSEKYKFLKVIKTIAKRGIPGSRNLGIEVSNGDLLAFFDMDMESGKGWPNELVSILVRNRKVGAVLPKVLDFNNREIIQAVGFKIDPHTAWVIPKGFGELDKGQYNHTEEIAIGAAGSIIRRKVIEEVGGFDESLGMFDDIDMGWRIRLSGWKTLCVPKATIYHWTAKSMSTRLKSTSLLIHDFYIHNISRSFLKNFEFKSLIRYLPQREMIMFVRDFKYFFQGNTIPIRSLLLTFFWNLANLSKTIEERKKVKRNRKVNDSQLFNDIFFKGSFWEVYKNGLLPIIERSKAWRR